MPDKQQNTPLLTVKQMSQKHPAFPVGGLRWMIFNEDTNGLANAKAIVRIGRRVYFHEQRFLKTVGALD